MKAKMKNKAVLFVVTLATVAFQSQAFATIHFDCAFARGSREVPLEVHAASDTGFMEVTETGIVENVDMEEMKAKKKNERSRYSFTIGLTEVLSVEKREIGEMANATFNDYGTKRPGQCLTMEDIGP